MSGNGKWARRWQTARVWSGAGRRQLGTAAWLFVYHTRLLFTRQTVFLVTGISALVGVVTVRASVSSPADCLRILQAFEAGVFILMSMGLVTQERDKGTFEMTLVSTRGFHQLILIKFLPSALWALALGVAAAWALSWRVGGFPLAKGLFFAYTTGMLAGMSALCLSVFFRNGYAAGAATVIASFALYAHYGAEGHRNVLDPFLQVFEETDWRLTAGLVFWNRFYTLAATGLLYDQTIRRMRRTELWVK